MHEAMFFEKTLVISPFVPFEGIDLEYPRRLILQRMDAPTLAAAICVITAHEYRTPSVPITTLQRLHDYYDIGRVVRETEEFYREACEYTGIRQETESVVR